MANVNKIVPTKTIERSKKTKIEEEKKSENDGQYT